LYIHDCIGADHSTSRPFRAAKNRQKNIAYVCSMAVVYSMVLRLGRRAAVLASATPPSHPTHSNVLLTDFRCFALCF